MCLCVHSSFSLHWLLSCDWRRGGDVYINSFPIREDKNNLPVSSSRYTWLQKFIANSSSKMWILVYHRYLFSTTLLRVASSWTDANEEFDPMIQRPFAFVWHNYGFDDHLCLVIPASPRGNNASRDESDQREQSLYTRKWNAEDHFSVWHVSCRCDLWNIIKRMQYMYLVLL